MLMANAVGVFLGPGMSITSTQTATKNPAQVGHPEWHIGFESDADLASATRSKVKKWGRRKTGLS